MERNDKKKKKNQQSSRPNSLHSKTFLLDMTRSYTLAMRVDNSPLICEVHICNYDGMAFDQYPCRHWRDIRHRHDGRTHPQILWPCCSSPPPPPPPPCNKVWRSTTLYLEDFIFLCFWPRGIMLAILKRGALGFIIQTSKSSKEAGGRVFAVCLVAIRAALAWKQPCFMRESQTLVQVWLCLVLYSYVLCYKKFLEEQKKIELKLGGSAIIHSC